VLVGDGLTELEARRADALAAGVYRPTGPDEAPQ
jgi:hypothetical protein